MQVKMGMGRKRVSFMEDGKVWQLPGLLYADDLAQCEELEEDLGLVVGWFAEVCRRRGLRVNAGGSRGMVLSGDEGLECEVHVDAVCLEHVSSLNVLGVFWTSQVRMGQSAVGGREREEGCR